MVDAVDSGRKVAERGGRTARVLGVVSAIVVTVFGIVAVTYHVTADYGPAYPYVLPQWSPDGIAGIVTFVGGGAFGVIQFVLARYTFVGWLTVGSMAFATVTWFSGPMEMVPYMGVIGAAGGIAMLFGTLLLCIDDDGRLRGLPKRVFATVYALNWVLMGLAALLIDHPRAPTLFAVIADADLAIALFDGPWWAVSLLVGDVFAIVVLVTEAIRERSSRMRRVRWVAAVAAIAMTAWGNWEFVLPVAVADAAIAQILQSVVSALFEPINATIIVTAARRGPARSSNASEDPNASELVPAD